MRIARAAIVRLAAIGSTRYAGRYGGSRRDEGAPSHGPAYGQSGERRRLGRCTTSTFAEARLLVAVVTDVLLLGAGVSATSGP
jgi:hypothetical protein